MLYLCIMATTFRAKSSFRAPKLSDEKKRGIFKTLEDKSYIQTGLEFGLDKYFPTQEKMKMFVLKVVNEVKSDPARFSLSTETIDKVSTAVALRSSTPRIETLREKREDYVNADIKTLVLEGRARAMSLLNKKLEHLASTPRRLDEISAGELAKVTGILIDKGQILSGEATEHVAIMAKIDKDMSPDMAIETILKMREINQAK